MNVNAETLAGSLPTPQPKNSAEDAKLPSEPHYYEATINGRRYHGDVARALGLLVSERDELRAEVDRLRAERDDADARATALQGVIDRCVMHIRQGMQLRDDELDAGLEALVVAWTKYHGDCCSFKRAVDAAVARAEAAEAVIARQLGDCIGCTTDPDETCPRDGRSYTEWVEIASRNIGRANAAEAERDAAVARAEAAEAREVEQQRWISEAVLALDAATVIAERMSRTGRVEGLHLANHDRLIREARQWSDIARYSTRSIEPLSRAALASAVPPTNQDQQREQWGHRCGECRSADGCDAAAQCLAASPVQQEDKQQ